MQQYPIWNQVQACIYKSDKSYGVRNEGVVNVKVGTSRTYSYDFVKQDIGYQENIKVSFELEEQF